MNERAGDGQRLWARRAKAPAAAGRRRPGGTPTRVGREGSPLHQLPRASLAAGMLGLDAARTAFSPPWGPTYDAGAHLLPHKACVSCREGEAACNGEPGALPPIIGARTGRAARARMRPHDLFSLAGSAPASASGTFMGRRAGDEGSRWGRAGGRRSRCS